MEMRLLLVIGQMAKQLLHHSAHCQKVRLLCFVQMDLSLLLRLLQTARPSLSLALVLALDQTETPQLGSAQLGSAQV